MSTSINQLLNELLIMTTNTSRVQQQHLYLSSRRRINVSRVTGNLSRNASLRTLVPMARPSSDPLPLVLAVAITLKPLLGLTYLPIFFRNTPLPSRMDWKQRILFEARSISSSSRIAPLSSASMTGPLCQTVAPSTRRKPPIRSSSSVSMVMFTNYFPLELSTCLLNRERFAITR